MILKTVSSRQALERKSWKVAIMLAIQTPTAFKTYYAIQLFLKKVWQPGSGVKLFPIKTYAYMS